MERPIEQNKDEKVGLQIQDAFSRLMPGDDFAIRVFTFQSNQYQNRGETFQLTRERDGTLHLHFKHGILTGHFQFDPIVDENRLRYKTDNPATIKRGQDILGEIVTTATLTSLSVIREEKNGEGLVSANSKQLLAPILGDNERKSLLGYIRTGASQEYNSQDPDLKWISFTEHNSGFTMRYTSVDPTYGTDRNFVAEFDLEGRFTSINEVINSKRVQMPLLEVKACEFVFNRLLLTWFEAKVASPLDLSKFNL